MRAAIALLLPALWLSAVAARAEEQGFIDTQGDLWVTAAWEGWRADERFAGPFGADLNYRGPDGMGGQVEVGDRVPIKLDVPDSRFRSDALWLKVRAKPLPRMLLAVSMPVYQRLEFTQTGGETVSEGPGDVFTTLGYQLTPSSGDRRVGTSVYAHVKFPTRQAQFEDFTVPLSEGQYDVALESSTAVWLGHYLRLTGSFLFRFRTLKEAQVGDAVAKVKLGNETELFFEAGGAAHELLWLKTSYLGMFAAASEDRSIENDFRALQKRQIHWWQAGVYYRFGGHLPSGHALSQLALDLGFRFPLAGQDFLRGPTLRAGLAWQLGFDRRAGDGGG